MKTLLLNSNFNKKEKKLFSNLNDSIGVIIKTGFLSYQWIGYVEKPHEEFKKNKELKINIDNTFDDELLLTLLEKESRYVDFYKKEKSDEVYLVIKLNSPYNKNALKIENIIEKCLSKK